MNKLNLSNKQNAKKLSVAILVLAMLTIGACFDTKKSNDNTPLLLGLFLLNQNNTTPSCANSQAGCRIFLTEGTWDGNLGGIAGADAKCNADSRKPVGRTLYKALIVDGQDRNIVILDVFSNPSSVSGAVDWPLRANQKYINIDGSEFATTTEQSIFFGNGTAMELDNWLQNGENSLKFWTGLDFDGSGNFENFRSCEGWSSGSNLELSAAGEFFSGSPDYMAFYNSLGSGCNNSFRLVCVEQ